MQDYRTQHVQDDIRADSFINASTVLISMGPPFFSQAASSSLGSSSKDAFYPVGVVDQLTVGQAKDVQRLFEIGSDLSYFIHGRTTNNLTIARTLYNGPSLLRVAMAYYPKDKLPSLSIYDSFDQLNVNLPNDVPEITSPPGVGNFWLNLQSDLFKQPLGILLLARNQDGSTYGSVYLEECHIAGHQFTIQAGSTIIGEGCQMLFQRVIPVAYRIENDELRRRAETLITP